MPDLKTSDFDFDLPPERIAQTAIEPRDHARLLHVTPDSLADRHIYDLPDLLRAGDLLILNDTRVIPARLFGKRGEMRVEILLHKKQNSSEWLAFARPGKRLRIGDTLIFGPDFSAEILAKHETGEVLLRFYTNPSLTLKTEGATRTPPPLAGVGKGVGALQSSPSQDQQLLTLLHRYGEPPLPPYIKRESGAAKNDSARYQTIYAAHDGAVAAPTAGLHFTPELLEKLKSKGIDIAKVTLHVGAGTFLPVKADYIKDHVMHAEWGEISAATAAALNQARGEKRRIVCVGTTSLRVVESAADESGTVHPFARDTSIFITPGYRFRVADALLTNFHLPQSTLFMLVSAFMGLERMRAAYEYAIKNDYRFYSYGDASLLERNDHE